MYITVAAIKKLYYRRGKFIKERENKFLMNTTVECAVVCLANYVIVMNFNGPSLKFTGFARLLKKNPSPWSL